MTFEQSPAGYVFALCICMFLAYTILSFLKGTVHLSCIHILKSIPIRDTNWNVKWERDAHLSQKKEQQQWHSRQRTGVNWTRGVDAVREDTQLEQREDTLLR